MRLLCDVYRTGRQEEMYLYVARQEGLSRVPEALLDRFGAPELALTLLLEPGRQLARAAAERVIEAIQDQGFYLQLPPERQSGEARLREGVREGVHKVVQEAESGNG